MNEPTKTQESAFNLEANQARSDLKIPREILNLPPQERQQEYNKIRDKQVELIATLLEQVRDEDIAFTSLPHTEKTRESGKPKVENKGLVDVQLDLRVIALLLKVCGVDDKDLEELEIKFDTARLSHRNVKGEPVAGVINGNKLEIYSSFPADFHKSPSSDVLTKVHTAILMFTEKEVIGTLAHELRHYIQDKVGMYPEGIEGSFVSDEYESLLHEQDSIDFENKLAHILERFIVIKNNPIFGDASEQVDAENPFVKNGYAKPEIVAVLSSDDDDFAKLSMMLKKCSNEGRFVSDTDVREALDLIEQLQKGEKIGFGEHRIIVEELREAVKDSDDVLVKAYLEGRLNLLDTAPGLFVV